MTNSIIGKLAFNDGSRPTKINYKRTRHYGIWLMLITRCLDDKYKSKHPAYKDCTISENFKHYSYFYDWCENQIGFNLDNSFLDKDLLIKNNKHYSEDTCVFVPDLINNSLSCYQKNNGEYPMGVTIRKSTGKFRAVLGKYGRKVELGCFSSPNHAFMVYKREKESYIRELAEVYKSEIDPRAYDALMCYEAEITD